MCCSIGRLELMLSLSVMVAFFDKAAEIFKTPVF